MNDGYNLMFLKVPMIEYFGCFQFFIYKFKKMSFSNKFTVSKDTNKPTRDP